MRVQSAACRVQLRARSGWLLAVLAALAAFPAVPGGWGGVAWAQDTVVVIDPDAPPIPLRSLRGPPPEVVEEALGRYNDTTVTRSYGSFTVASGTVIRGDVAVYRGTLRVVGRITGRITVINGDLIVGPLGTLDGDVLVLGGRVVMAPSARHTGARREYADPAPVLRTAAGILVARRTAGAIPEITAQTSFQAGRLRTTLALETGRNYNRVEGLPILAGPTFSFPTPNRGEARVELWGLLRTEKDETDRLSQFGWLTRFEYEARGGLQGGIGFKWESRLKPIEDVQLGRSELSWSTFLFHRDYDDYFRARGVEGYGYLYPIPSLRVQGSLRFDDERTVHAGDPISLLRADAPWRANPLIDDGGFITLRAEATLDTRNSTVTPTSGWFARAWFERSVSDDVAPLALPTEIRDPIPTFRSYAFNKIWFDVRTHARINQISRANVRLLGGGWLGGDPLPIQRRVSAGGPGILPGLPFRAQNCAPQAFTDPALTAFCDRMLAAQAEVRFRVPLRFLDLLGADEMLVLDRLFGGDLADVVVFGDMGKAWLSGDGPGRVPHNRLPVLREWDYDVGIGLDLGGLAFYLAKSLSTSESPRLTFRLQRRF